MTHLGKYRIERPLGAGAFATVWLARDEDLDAPVAIKVLAENWSRNDDVRRRFVDEARILRQIDSDRVVRVFTIDELDDGRPYFVMEWADRGTLYDRVARRSGGGPLPLAEAVGYALEIARCLWVVHEFGMVHRDVKPSNVLFRSVAAHHLKRLGKPERVLLGDFGLAKEVVGSSGFTVAAGTPAYSAPEQIRGSAAIDHRADFYALCVVLYELLVGAVPFGASTFREAQTMSLAGIPVPSDTRPDVPPALDAFVRRGLSPDPADRFVDTDEFIDGLVAILDALGQEPTAEAETPEALEAAAPTGLVARALHVIDRASELLGAPAELVAVRERLLGPGRLGVFAVDEAAAAQVDIALWHTGLQPAVSLWLDDARAEKASELAGCDALLLAAPIDDLPTLTDALRSALSGSVAGPIAVAALVTSASVLSRPLVAPSTIDLLSARDVTVPEPIALVAPVTQAGEVIELVERVLLDSSQTIGVSAALAELADLSRNARPPESLGPWRLIDDLVDRLRVEAWRTEEADLARADVRGALTLPSALRADVRRLLVEGDSARRLGLESGATDDHVRAAATDALERWHGLVGSQRIPFRARPQAEVVVRCLERLWVSVGG